ncbi:MAG: hypothetical protein WBC04_10695 [Candidatus Acidiferrales bacterium]
MKLIKRASLFSISVLAVLFAAVCGYTKWQAYESRKGAEAFLADLRRIKVGEATLADVQQLARTHSRFLWKGDPYYKDEWWSVDFLYESYHGNNNILRRIRLWRLDLWRFHLAPEDCIFTVSFDVHRDRLERTTMMLSSDYMPRTFSATVTDEVPEISPVGQPYVVEDARPQYISIYIKPSATPAQRDYAYSFNLKCMDKIGGCRDKNELLLGPLPR